MIKSAVCHVLQILSHISLHTSSSQLTLPPSPLQTDGSMSSYGNLPSNLLMSGESVYENFSAPPLPYLSPDNNYDSKAPATSDYDNHTITDTGTSTVYDNTAVTDSVSYCGYHGYCVYFITMVTCIACVVMTTE